MPNIPGLSVRPVDDDKEGEGVKIDTYTGAITIPDSHRFGNCRTIEDFEKLGKITEGSFGIIYKCKDKSTNEVYALKKYQLSIDIPHGIPSSMLREISLLNHLKHVNIINSYGAAAGIKLASNYLILDFWNFSLDDLIKKEVNEIYEKGVVKSIMKQVFRALEYIHESLIIHRDITCQNIIFTEAGILKITGFGASRFYSRGNMTPGITELTYRAPELLLQTQNYGPAVDMWSAGCVFAKLLLQRALFSGNSEFEVLKSIYDVIGTPSENIWPGFTKILSEMKNTGSFMEDKENLLEEEIVYSKLGTLFLEHPLSCQEFIQELLMYNPIARPDAKVCLQCPYFTDVPPACSHDTMVSILKKALPPEEPMTSG